MDNQKNLKSVLSDLRSMINADGQLAFKATRIDEFGIHELLIIANAVKVLGDVVAIPPSKKPSKSNCRYCGGVGKFQILSPVSDHAWATCFCSRDDNQSVNGPVYERKAGWENDGVIIHESDIKAAREITAKAHIGYGESIRRGEEFVERVEAVALGHALARKGLE